MFGRQDSALVDQKPSLNGCNAEPRQTQRASVRLSRITLDNALHCTWTSFGALRQTSTAFLTPVG